MAAGGTGGHLMPALAVAEALRERGVDVSFAGSPSRIEARLVPEAGFPFDPFPISGLPRRPGLPLLRALGQAFSAPLACLRILRRRRPQVVLGGGGYVAGPMVLAAWLARIPATLSEADAHLGLANRLAAPFASRVFLSFPIPGRGGAKYRLSGRALSRRGAELGRREARRLFGLPEEGPLLLVFGGSQGAHALNELVAERFAEQGPAILHLAGERDAPGLRARVSRRDYVVLDFTREFGAALVACDLGLARAGGSVWELAAAGKPGVLVPYPYATADHQTKNARYFAESGGVVVVPETELPHVPGLILELLADPGRLERMGAAMLALARPRAADEIADELVALAEQKARKESG
ncbi:MAG: UDP-N-acetylglucosamine--N-acetylmuramyl-(pentapeptide) pyrophosphoryl-undecaprenol N-acetylglucosamine transferase [Gaiellaceae bacterium]